MNRTVHVYWTMWKPGWQTTYKNSMKEFRFLTHVY